MLQAPQPVGCCPALESDRTVYVRRSPRFGRNPGGDGNLLGSSDDDAGWPHTSVPCTLRLYFCALLECPEDLRSDDSDDLGSDNIVIDDAAPSGLPLK